MIDDRANVLLPVPSMHLFTNGGCVAAGSPHLISHLEEDVLLPVPPMHLLTRGGEGVAACSLHLPFHMGDEVLRLVPRINLLISWGHPGHTLNIYLYI